MFFTYYVRPKRFLLLDKPDFLGYYKIKMITRFYDKFTGLWETSEDLGQSAVRSSAILFFGKFITKGIAFVRTIIIARLLLPQDLGLFGLASLAVATTGIFFQTGLNDAIVQEKDDVQKHLNSVWTVNLFINLTLSAVIFLVSAPLAGIFFHNDKVVLITRAMSAMLFIQAFETIGPVLWQRELRFNFQFFYNVIGFGMQSLVTILAAWYFRNFWGLVAGAISARVIYIILGYTLHSFRPKLDFSLIGVRHLFKYGKWVGLTGIILFFVNQGDYLTIGRLLDESSLAFYQLAFSLGTLPAMEIVGVLGALLFPLYANIQGDKEKLKNAFLRISRMAFTLSIPASIGLLVLAKEIVTFVYGSKWLPMVPVLYVITFYGLIKAFELITEPLFRGIGKPHISTIVTLAQFGVMFSFIVPLTKMYGSVGTASAVFLGFLTAQAIFLVQLRREISISIISLLKVSVLPIIASLAMGVFIFETKQLVPINTKILLLLFIGSGVFVYGIILWILDRMFGRNLYSSIIWIKERL